MCSAGSGVNYGERSRVFEDGSFEIHGFGHVLAIGYWSDSSSVVKPSISLTPLRRDEISKVLAKEKRLRPRKIVQTHFRSDSWFLMCRPRSSRKWPRRPLAALYTGTWPRCSTNRLENSFGPEIYIVRSDELAVLVFKQFTEFLSRTISETVPVGDSHPSSQAMNYN